MMDIKRACDDEHTAPKNSGAPAGNDGRSFRRRSVRWQAMGTPLRAGGGALTAWR
jgi:hypothetical protein